MRSAPPPLPLCVEGRVHAKIEHPSQIAVERVLYMARIQYYGQPVGGIVNRRPVCDRVNQRNRGSHGSHGACERQVTHSDVACSLCSNLCCLYAVDRMLKAHIRKTV